MKSNITLVTGLSQTASQAMPPLKPLVLAILAMVPWTSSPVLAVEGGQVVNGQGSVTSNGTTTTINQQSNTLILNWKNLNIAPNERVQFLQPSSSSLALNRISSSDPTSIFGQLLANGQIFLINPNGITFGAGAQVNVGGLVASTLDISNADFLGGATTGKFTFSAPGSGHVVNQGSIKTSNGGYVALIAKQVSNQGSLNAPEGSVALAAGERVTLSHASGLFNVSVDAATLHALVENKQAIRADGGQVILSANAENALLNTVVNQTGIVEARSIENKNGRIFLSGGASGVVNVSGTLNATGSNNGERGGTVTIAGANIALNKGASIDASGASGGGTVLVGGDYQGGSDTPHANALWMDATAHIAANATLDGRGGQVVLWSDEATRAYGNVSATGIQGGGLVETSGHYLDVAGIRIDASSINGPAGLWSLDPNNISIQTAGANTNISAGPNFTTTKDSAILTTATIQTALNAGSGTSVTITTGRAAPNTQAGNITFATNSKINYSGSNAGVGLTLNADNNIVANAGTAITASAGKLDVTFNAGKQASGNGVITLATSSIASNGGKITLNGAPNGGGASGPRGILLTASTLDAAGGDIAFIATGGTTSATTNRGVEISGSTLTTNGAGNISLTGTGGSKANNYGVLLTATSKLQTATGNVTLNGTAGSASTATGIGVLMDTTSSIVSTTGKITISGTGSSSATGTANHGVQINSTSGVTSTSGDIQIAGSSGAGTSNDVGVRIVGGSPLTTGGNINISGTSNGTGTTTSYGVEINNGKITTTGTGNISVTGGGGGKTNGYGVFVTASSKLQSADGSTTLVGSAGKASTGTGIGLLIDTTSNIVTNTGKIALTGTGSSSATGAANHGVQINTTSGVTSTSGDIQITGNSGAGTSNDVGVRIVGGSSVTTGGNITISGTSKGTGTTTSYGVEFNNAKLTTTGTGIIAAIGNGGGKTNGYGVLVTGSSKLQSASGSATLTGTAGNASTGTGIGVLIDTTSNIISTTGNIAILGTGSSGATGAANHGVQINTTSNVTSTSGDIQITGVSGAGSSNDVGVRVIGAATVGSSGNIVIAGTSNGNGTSNNYGVEINNGQITSSGAGNVAITGNGGGKSTGYGTYITASAKVQTANGSVTLIGNAGATSTANGIGLVLDNKASTVSGAGNISITGNGSSGATGTANHGVQINSINGVSSATGNIQITGTSGAGTGNDAGVRIIGAAPIATGGSAINVSGKSLSSGATAGNLGVEISAASTITNSNAAGLIDINGTAGDGAGTNRFGVTIAGATVQSTAGGSLNITGMGGGKFAGINIAAANPVIGNAATKNITLTTSNGGGGDALAIAAGSKLLGSGTLTVQGANAADTMGVGGAASATFSLQADTNELITLQPGFADIVFGRSDGSGTITIGAGSTNTNTTIKGNTSNLTINGAFITTGAKLTVATAGTATESGAGTLTVNAGTGTLQLQNGGTYNLVNNNNTGSLNANAAALNFRDDTGFTVSGIATTGNVTLSTTGNVAQTGTIVAGPGSGGTLNLNGVGGVYNLCSQDNDIDTLNANTKTVAFKDINSYALGTLTLTGALELAGDYGTTGKITALSFLFDAPSQNITFTNTGTIGTLAANAAGFNYSQAGSLIIGKVSNVMCNPGTLNGITSSNNIALKTTAANSDITLAANTPITFTGGAPGTVTLSAQRNVVLNSAASIGSSGQAIDVTLNANLQGTVAGGGAVTLTGATLNSSDGNIVLAGDPSATGFASNKTGNGITLDATMLDAGSGAITLRGEGRGVANARGVSLLNSSTVKSSAGTISISGKNADVSALAGQSGVSIATNSTVTASGANDIILSGSSGAGKGAGNAGVIVQSGANVSANDGALNVSGISIASGDQAIGVIVTGAGSKIANVGNGTLNINGAGSSAVTATNAVGISIANTASILGKDGATNLIGTGGTNSAGVQIDNATVGANGLSTFTITASGNGTAAGLATSGAQPTLLADQGGTLALEASNGGGADALILVATTKIQGNGNLIVRGANAVDTLGIGGGASAAYSLQIDQTELTTIQPGLAGITFGRSDGTGKITIADGSSNAATTIQAATAGIDILGTYSTAGADLTIRTGGIATEAASNHALIVNGGAGTLNLLGGGSYNLCKGNNDVGSLTANATEIAFNDINNLSLGAPFTVTNDVALGVNGTLTAPSGINGGGLILFGNNVAFNNVGNIAKLAATVSGDFSYTQSNSYALDSVNNVCLGGAVNGITAGGNVSLGVAAGNKVTQSATGQIGGNGLSLNGGRFNLTQSNSIATLSAAAQDLAVRDDNGYDVSGVNVSGATLLISNGGAVIQSGAIVSNGLALVGAGGDFTLNHSGNRVATLAGNANRIDYRQSDSLAIGSVTGVDFSVTNGIAASDRMIIQTTGALADLTLNSPVTAQGTGFAAVLSTQRNLLNNGGASELQTPNGHWALYANNPSSSVFGGLTAPINLFEHSIGTLPPASLPSGANAIVFQSLTPPAPTPTPPPVAELPTATFVSAGLQWRELNSAESSYSELLDDVRGFDFLDLWKRFGYVPLEVMNGGMKLAHGLAIQEVEMQKMRRRLGISGDREPRYFWWR